LRILIKQEVVFWILVKYCKKEMVLKNLPK
jgi:hypothetical protein